MPEWQVLSSLLNYVCGGLEKRAEPYTQLMRDSITDPEPSTPEDEIRAGQLAEVAAILGITATVVLLVFWGFAFSTAVRGLAAGLPLENVWGSSSVIGALGGVGALVNVSAWAKTERRWPRRQWPFIVGIVVCAVLPLVTPLMLGLIAAN